MRPLRSHEGLPAAQRRASYPERLITVLPHAPTVGSCRPLSAPSPKTDTEYPPVMGFAHPPRNPTRNGTRRASPSLSLLLCPHPPCREEASALLLPSAQTPAASNERSGPKDTGLFIKSTAQTFTERMAEIDKWNVCHLAQQLRRMPPEPSCAPSPRGAFPSFRKPTTPPRPPHRPPSRLLYPAHEMEAAASSLTDLLALSPDKRRIIIKQNPRRPRQNGESHPQSAWSEFLWKPNTPAPPRPLAARQKLHSVPLWPLRIYSTFIQYARTGQFEFERPIVEVS